MTKNSNPHLSNETLMRWQMGDATKPERIHVAECPECQAQAKPLQDALSWFGAAARQWGEERAALLQEWHDAKDPAPQESKVRAAWSWRSMAATWALVSVAILLIFGIGVPRWKAHQAAIEARLQQQRHSQDQTQELARDNALLEEVDQDVSQEVPVALQPLSWNTASGNAAAGSTGNAASRQ